MIGIKEIAMNEPTKRGPGRPRKVVAEATVEAKPKKARRERVSFNASRMRLNIELNENLESEYHVRWFNDQDDRISRATRAGWDFVYENELEGHVGDKEVHGGSSDLNNKVSKVVGKDGTVAFALKICNEFWEADQAEKAKKNDQVDDAIRAGQSGGASVANQYGDVSLTRR
jgi:hypothetical protein